MPYTEVINPESGDTLIRIEYFQEFDPRNPTAYERFLARQASARQEIAAKQWATVVYDSVSSLELAVRMNSKWFLNPATKEPRQHFSYSTDQLEELLSMTVGGLFCNVVTICHVDSERDEVRGTFVHNPSFPGRLRRTIAKDYAEFYYQYAGWDPDTKDYFYALQTRTRDQHAAASQIKAPDPCFSNYETLWTNYTGPRRPIHCLVYGEPGAGKSTFAATFPKPLLVFLFDALGKDTPYLAPEIGTALPIAD